MGLGAATVDCGGAAGENVLRFSVHAVSRIEVPRLKT